VSALKLLAEVASKTDNVIKYVFELSDGAIMEVSTINKGDGKWSICLPTHTACNMGCRFCLMTEIAVPSRPLLYQEMIDAIRYSVLYGPFHAPTLLISFMGCGEPLLNTASIIRVMEKLNCWRNEKFSNIRFAIATMLPRARLLDEFAHEVNRFTLNVKVHLSLHGTTTDTRRHLIPASKASPRESVEALRRYRDVTGRRIEIHYTLISGINDSFEDATALRDLLRGTGISVCFIRFNEGADKDLYRSVDTDRFRNFLHANGIESESYTPPGADIGASCGQFTKTYYQRWTIA